MSFLINRDKLAGAYINFNTAFNKALMESKLAYQPIVTEFQSDAPVEQYNWLGSVPLMKKWVGDREMAKLVAEKYQITNVDWANGIEVSRDDLRDDKLGLVATRIGDLARQGLKRIDAEVANILNNAFGASGGLTYDGQYLIDTDHTASTQAGQTAQSNSAGTTAISATAFEAGIEAMMAFKDDFGEPMGIFPTHLVVGPSAWAAARLIVQQITQASGAQNLNYSLVQLVVNPRITGNKWFLVDMSQGVGPLILQMRQPPVFRDPNLGENSMEFFMRKAFRYGADMTFGTGPGLWQTIYGSNAT